MNLLLSLHFTEGHYRQDSMEPSEEWGIVDGACHCAENNHHPHHHHGHMNMIASSDFKKAGRKMKTLERRRKQQQERWKAHSLVGTPNYIAPEVLMREGKSSCYPYSHKLLYTLSNFEIKRNVTSSR